jgi:hypothetical protein
MTERAEDGPADDADEAAVDAGTEGDTSEPGLLDRVERVVDELLGEDIPLPVHEDPWERRLRKLDAWTALVLGLAAVATAWATYQSSQWSEVQAQVQYEAASLRTDAARAASDASGDRIVDAELWLNWLSAVANDQLDRAAFFRDRFSPALDLAQREWLAAAPNATPTDPTSAARGTPLDLDAYVPGSQVRSDRLASEAEERLVEASEANSNAAAFILAALILSLSLFFGGIATKFTSPKAQVGLLIASIAALTLAIIRMALLPQVL